MLILQIICDKCHKVGGSDYRVKAHSMRRALKSQGWKHIECHGIDLCPECKNKPETRNPNHERKVNETHHS